MNHLDNNTLNLYLDEALDEKTRAEVDAHLASCEMCQRELSELHALVSTFDAWRNEPIPRDVSRVVVTRIAQRPAPLQRTRWAAVLLGAQAILAVLILMWALPIVLRAVNGLPFQVVPTFDFDFSAYPFAWSNWLTLPSVALWIWAAVLGIGVIVWFVANRLLLHSLEQKQETSQ